MSDKRIQLEFVRLKKTGPSGVVFYLDGEFYDAAFCVGRAKLIFYELSNERPGEVSEGQEKGGDFARIMLKYLAGWQDFYQHVIEIEQTLNEAFRSNEINEAEDNAAQILWETYGNYKDWMGAGILEAWGGQTSTPAAPPRPAQPTPPPPLPMIPRPLPALGVGTPPPHATPISKTERERTVAAVQAGTQLDLAEGQADKP